MVFVRSSNVSLRMNKDGERKRKRRLKHRLGERERGREGEKF